MESLKRAARPVQRQRTLCCPPPAGPSAATDSPRSEGLWRPWLFGRSGSENVQFRKSQRLPYGPGQSAQVTGKHGCYSHPVRLFWPKSKCYDHFHQAGEALLRNFPVQATISFYEDSDSDSEDDSSDGEHDSGIESG